MNPDQHQIRALARQIREQGTDVRAEAHDLVSRCRAVGWTGLSGAAMAGQAAAQAHVLGRIAEMHDSAASMLEVHAAAVEQTLALIGEIERRVAAAVEAARSRLGRFVDGLLDAVDPLDEALVAFSPPPPGSPLWLEVRLPGLVLPGPRA
jgi:hypothetical protein